MVGDIDFMCINTDKSLAPVITPADIIALKRLSPWKEYISGDFIYIVVTCEYSARSLFLSPTSIVSTLHRWSSTSIIHLLSIQLFLHQTYGNTFTIPNEPTKVHQICRQVLMSKIIEQSHFQLFLYYFSFKNHLIWF